MAAFIRSRIKPPLRKLLNADEILQDTFVRAFQSIAGFRGDDEDSLVRWLMGMARIAVV